ncbi:MAG: sigma-54-dependent Fis family transcriptional regulator, partial [Candidatus Marinimicrobia bacterium]|nr:sigma-54-dependent Fis family transcriptional regulator [Candidatus Neomarinimicrobiota bacterium]
QITSRISRFFDFSDLQTENKQLKEKLSKSESKQKMVGISPSMQLIYNQIEIVANSDVPVFIEGESGTGKELIAQAIHDNSGRQEMPFLKINCSAIPDTLIESTLFGHEKGAYTHAVKTTKGYFEEADGGTFLLDEITEMPLTMQAKLLRVLQEGVITRVGSSKEISVDVRVIATSNRNVQQAIKDSLFRQDLYYRLNVFPLKVQPLRSRPDDIPGLIGHFLDKNSNKYNFENKELEKEALETLMAYHWPGNIRELENIIERAVLYSGKADLIKKEHFSFEENEESEKLGDYNGALMTVAEMEKILIYNTLKKTNNNRTQAADILQISVRTLRNKLHEYEGDLVEN